eukprot:GEMP01019294.1.p1 GENE.GEMP01019294.1~~GEMP01019294.1.p1  ORF type:complete len:525 (+),score=89.34 GEMP01019294.1:45-1619(+)
MVSDHSSMLIATHDHQGYESIPLNQVRCPYVDNLLGDRNSHKFQRESSRENLRFTHPSNDEIPAAKEKKYTLFQAVALNTLNMFGTGPFITIPLVLASTHPSGPHALIGYFITAIGCCLDSCIWAELGSRWPVSGGSYVYLSELFPAPYGRMMAFLYCWQFLITAPMEIASGFIAMAQYLEYITGQDDYLIQSLVAASLCMISIALLYQGVEEIGKVTTVLWAFTVGSIVFTLALGFFNFEKNNFAIPTNAYIHPWGFIVGIGAAARYGVYDFTGYYDVCQMGGEVSNPKKNIPRACIGTCLCVSVIYLLIYAAVMGALPLSELETADGQRFVMALFCEKLLNKTVAQIFVLVVCICIFGANFAMMCGSSYVPFAAARGGHFFSILGHRHPHRDGLADYSLLTIGILSVSFCFFRLDRVIQLMMTLMIVVQFMGQSVGLLLLRTARNRPHAVPSAEFKVPHAEVVCTMQLCIFSFALFTSPWEYLLFAFCVLAIGGGVFLFWTTRHFEAGDALDGDANVENDVH